MDQQEKILQIIVISGDAKSHAYEAIEKAKAGDAQGARESLEAARKELIEAHQYQTDMIISNDGKPVPADMLAAHAQDHMMCASTVIDLAGELCLLYETVRGLEALVAGKVQKVS